MRALPKQWKYWFSLIGVNIPRGKYNKFYPYEKRTNTYYRVNCRGEFQICDGDMSRWAVSVGATYPTIPKTEKEFLNAIVWLKLNRNRTSKTSTCCL